MSYQHAINKLTMKNYGIYVVSSDEEDFEPQKAGYDEVKQIAVASYFAESLDVLLIDLITRINEGDLAFNDWHFLTDENE